MIDGGGHDYPEQIKKDTMRDKYLKQQGFRVLRIWSSEVESNIEGVLDSILKVLEESKI